MHRPLEPVVFGYAIVLKIQDGQITNRPIYVSTHPTEERFASARNPALQGESSNGVAPASGPAPGASQSPRIDSPQDLAKELLQNRQVRNTGEVARRSPALPGTDRIARPDGSPIEVLAPSQEVRCRSAPMIHTVRGLGYVIKLR